MKKYYFSFIFFLIFGNSLLGQIELKINAYGFFYDIPYLSTEFFLSEKVGLEFGAGLMYGNRFGNAYEKKSMFIISSKYYLFEHNEHLYDNTFIGLYLSGKMNFLIDQNLFSSSSKEPSLVLGGMIGRKWMYTKKIFMEGNLGIGLTRTKHSFESNDFLFPLENEKEWKTDILLSFLVGYRF